MKRYECEGSFFLCPLFSRLPPIHGPEPFLADEGVDEGKGSKLLMNIGHVRIENVSHRGEVLDAYGMAAVNRYGGAKGVSTYQFTSGRFG